MKSKKELEIILSQVPKFRNPKAELEQHITPADLASTILWTAHLAGEIEGRVVADFGCGTGIFCKGAELLGAEECLCIDLDIDALEDGRSFLSSSDLVQADVLMCPLTSVDVVFMNPPFGTVKKGIDKAFLITALTTARHSVYSIHLASKDTERLFTIIASEHGFSAETIVTIYRMPIEYPWHRKRIHYMTVQVFKFKKSA